MAMNPSLGPANMNSMGGPLGSAPMPLMNTVAVNPQAAAVAVARQQMSENQRGVLNTYIYEYFLRYGMYDCARSLLSSGQQINVLKDGVGRRREDNAINGTDDAMDGDVKEDLDSKLPDDLPPPKLPMPQSDNCFLHEWFGIFWDFFNAQRTKGGNGIVNQYVAHTQQQSRLKQNHQQELLRQMRPGIDLATQQQYQAQMMRNMQNGNANMGLKQGNLARAAMANNQNPQMMLAQQVKQHQMQRDPSGMDPNRDRPSPPANGENAPSPSKRPRIDGGGPFNPGQSMMANGRPVQGMPGQQMAANPVPAAQQMLSANGINPNTLNPTQFQNFMSMPLTAQRQSMATYNQNLQQNHSTQMGGKQMPNPGSPQGQGSPIMQHGGEGSALTAFYNAGHGDMGGPGSMRLGPGGAQAAAGSNHALQDYQMQLMLLEQQNKKRLMMARQEQDNLPGMPRDGSSSGGPGPSGAPQVPNVQSFPEASPQAMRAGASPNPPDQMKRGTPQMNNSGIPSVPEGGQSRGSPNPGMSFMNNHVDPNIAPHFFEGMEGSNMSVAQAQMNSMRPPSSHPGQAFNGQMNAQQMMSARHHQQQQQQSQQNQQSQQSQQPQPQQSQQGQQSGSQGGPQQWQQAPNGQMVPPSLPQQGQQLQGTPQPRSMPPPSAPAVANANVNTRTTASPQQAAAAPPTPNQTNKAGPKKKESKAAKDKRTAAQKKANQTASNTATTSTGDAGPEADTAAPATPAAPINTTFPKNGQSSTTSNAQAATTTGATAATSSAPVPQGGAAMSQQGPGEPNQSDLMNMDNFGGMDVFGGIELTNPSTSSNVLNDFDFDSFLHDDNEPFDFNGTFPGMEGGEIGAE